MQCTEAALNKDFWHNLCAANTSLSRNIVAEIGQTIATYAVNLNIERQQLREFIQELTQALEQLDQAMIDPFRNDDNDDEDDGGFAQLLVNSTGTVATVGRPQDTEGWPSLPPDHPSYVPPPRHPDAANDETHGSEHCTPIATLTIIR